MKSKKGTVIALIVLILLIMFLPLLFLRGAEFGGSDGAGSDMVNEVSGGEYEPWFTPVFEVIIGGEIPGEVESLLFCLQTGIGVGVMAYGFGYLVARKKFAGSKPLKDAD